MSTAEGRLPALFAALAEVLDGPEPIEARAKAALLQAEVPDWAETDPLPLPGDVQEVLRAADAHPVCRMILDMPFRWCPPTTSDDPKYRAHSLAKVHVELVGPDGLVPSDDLRIGLYGMQAGAEYGLRTHPAEEVFVMLAGSAFWKRGDAPFAPSGPGQRSYHPSMMPHATRTGDLAFMSIYVWHGDVSTSGYVYRGLPQKGD